MVCPEKEIDCTSIYWAELLSQKQGIHTLQNSALKSESASKLEYHSCKLQGDGQQIDKMYQSMIPKQKLIFTVYAATQLNVSFYKFCIFVIKFSYMYMYQKVLHNTVTLFTSTWNCCVYLLIQILINVLSTADDHYIGLCSVGTYVKHKEISIYEI